MPLLYHGTGTRFLDSIWQQGLIAGGATSRASLARLTNSDRSRKAVRHAVVLTIRALEMSQEGYVFFLSENGVWLTEAVPARFLEALPE
jgi:putative RNA 2'-phosphotransferase